MRQLVKSSIAAAMIVAAAIQPLRADDAPTLDPAVKKQALVSLDRGARFLANRQDGTGMFGPIPQPAIAALGAMALRECPAENTEIVDAVSKRALTSVLGYVQTDGGIYDADSKRGAYPNYNTAICLLALTEFARDEDREAILKARGFLKRMQIDDPDSPFHGGFSYGGGGREQRPDLSNSAWIAEAMHASEAWEKDNGDTEASETTAVMWQKFDTFLKNTQKMPADGAAITDEADSDVGGFGYIPAADTSRLITSGSMSYAGLKSMLYARLTRDDARVQGMMRYVQHNYSVDQNPGQEMKGYYYYILLFAKALDANGQEIIETADGVKHHWRQELATKLISLQREDGAWVNSEGRFMESSPDLVTPYAMLALRIALAK